MVPDVTLHLSHNIKGDIKYGINVAGLGSDVQWGGVFSAVIWQRELGGDRGDAQGPDIVPTMGGATDHGDYGKTRGIRRVGLPIGRKGDGSHKAPPHKGVHQEA